MDFATAIADAMLVLNVGEKLVQIGEDVAPNIALAVSILEGKTTLTDADRTQLDADIKTYSDQIDAEVAADAAAGDTPAAD